MSNWVNPLWVNQLWASHCPHLGLLVKHIHIPIPGCPTTIDVNFVDGWSRSVSGYCVSFLGPTRYDFDSSSPQSYETHEFPFYSPNQNLFITSCEGLILFENMKGSIKTVCNPTTKMLKFLPRHVRDDTSPPLQSRVMHIATGFGKDCSKNRFKVVRIFYYCYYREQEPDEDYLGDTSVVQVYTLRKNANAEKWRRIECPDFVGSEIKSFKSTYVGGSYYWVNGIVTSKLLEFDFATEKFSTSSLPVDDNLAHLHHYEVFSCNGDLTLVGYNRQGKSGPGGNLFVFWCLDTSSSPPWKITNRLRFDLNVVRPIYVHTRFAFLEKKNGSNGTSVIIVHPLFNLEGIFEGISETFVLGFFDYTELTKVVTYDKSPKPYPLSNAQEMNGNYCFQEDGGADDFHF